MQTKRVLITGGTGFCGYWMSRTNPEDVIPYTIGHTYLDTQIFEEWNKVKWDAIVHLAPTTPAFILDYAKKHSIKVLYASSGAVYGDRLDYREYGEEKRKFEKMCLDSGVEVVIARLFTFIGKNLKNRYAITKFIEAAKVGNPIEVWGNGSSVRSYLYGEDLGNWLWHLLLDGEGCYDVGSDFPYFILEVARMVSEAFGWSVPINILHNEHEETRYVPDVTRALRLGCEETVDLKEAIRRTINE